MNTRTARIGFYGQEALFDFAASDSELEKLSAAAKQLALGETDVHLYYRLGIGEDTTAIISIREIQTITFLGDGRASDPGTQVFDADSLRDQSEASFYLKGREAPFRIDMDRGGPLGGMIEALLDTRYGDAGIGCVMLSDRFDNPIFLRLDEIQFAVFEQDLLEI